MPTPTITVEFQDTPNPNALKCVVKGGRLGSAPGDPPRSFRDASEAAADPLAAALFAVPGVVNVLLHDTWATVNKAPEAAWKSVRPGVERALKQGARADA